MAPNVNRPLILVLCGSALGVALIGALAMYFRRRKNKNKNRIYTDIYEVKKSSAITNARIRSRNSSTSESVNGRRALSAGSTKGQKGFYSTTTTEKDDKNISFDSKINKDSWAFNRAVGSDKSKVIFGDTIGGLSRRKKQFDTGECRSSLKEVKEDIDKNFISILDETLVRSESPFSSLHSEANSADTIMEAKELDKLGSYGSSSLTPVELYELGVDLVRKARIRWERALKQLENQKPSHNKNTVEDDTAASSTSHSLKNDCWEENLKLHIQEMLSLTDRIKDNQFDTLDDMRRLSVVAGNLGKRGDRGMGGEILSRMCTSAAMNAALDEMDKEFEVSKTGRKSKYLFDDSSSDIESFYSAFESVDLSDLEEHKDSFQHLALYEMALQELTEGEIPFRCLRTKQVNCLSDTEFLAKLFCIRLAFENIFCDKEKQEWFINLGRDLFSSILKNADKEVEDFYMIYNDMIDYILDPVNKEEMIEELTGRGLKVMSFFDILIDFLLFDAFDDLDNPPSSLIAIMQNRWLTNGFKETALLTAVWSVLKAKRAMLKFPKGFMAKFYSISEITSPVLAWGFLGPDGPLKNMCNYFKNQIMHFMHELFSFNTVRYTTIEELSQDVMKLAQNQAEVMTRRLSIPLSSWNSLNDNNNKFFNQNESKKGNINSINSENVITNRLERSKNIPEHENINESSKAIMTNNDYINNSKNGYSIKKIDSFIDEFSQSDKYLISSASCNNIDTLKENNFLTNNIIPIQSQIEQSSLNNDISNKMMKQDETTINKNNNVDHEPALSNTCILKTQDELQDSTSNYNNINNINAITNEPQNIRKSISFELKNNYLATNNSFSNNNNTNIIVSKNLNDETFRIENIHSNSNNNNSMSDINRSNNFPNNNNDKNKYLNKNTNYSMDSKNNYLNNRNISYSSSNKNYEMINSTDESDQDLIFTMANEQFDRGSSSYESCESISKQVHKINKLNKKQKKHIINKGNLKGDDVSNNLERNSNGYFDKNSSSSLNMSFDGIPKEFDKGFKLEQSDICNSILNCGLLNESSDSSYKSFENIFKQNNNEHVSESINVHNLNQKCEQSDINSSCSYESLVFNPRKSENSEKNLKELIDSEYHYNIDSAQTNKNNFKLNNDNSCKEIILKPIDYELKRQMGDLGDFCQKNENCLKIKEPMDDYIKNGETIFSIKDGITDDKTLNNASDSGDDMTLMRDSSGNEENFE